MMRRNVYPTCDIQLPKGKKYVAVNLLTLDTLYFVVDVKSKVDELFDEVCKYLGLIETELFGLSINTDGSGFIFLDPTVKLCKFALKQWKLQNNGLDSTGKPLFSVYFRVQFYVDSYLFISDKVAKLLYYLQLRENVLNYGQALCEEKIFLLASYALQADFGNFNPEKHQLGQYFNPHYYFPCWVIEQIGLDYIIRNLPFLHRDHKGMHKIDAQSMYIKEASDSIAPHNLHLYKLKCKKLTNEVWLGICPSGIKIYTEEDRNGHSQIKQKNPLSFFAWPDIGKLYFEKKKFEIQSVSYPIRKFTYFASGEDMARHLLWLCRVTHQFQLHVQSKMKEVKKREQELNKKSFTESYVYSGPYEFPYLNRNRKKSNQTNSPSSVRDETGTQRVSVISNASSNTTSGIVSDKVQSLEDSDRDDIDIEIMMNSQQNTSVDSVESLTTTDLSEKLIPNTVISTQQTSDTINNSDSCIKEVKRKQNQVHSSANSTKSTSSEQSTTTVKSVIPSNVNDLPTTQIITIVNNISDQSNKKYHSDLQTTKSLEGQKTSSTSPLHHHHHQQHKKHKKHNSCAIGISQLQINDLSVKNIDVLTFSKLSERSESMNHIYENIPYFSHFNQTPKKQSSPPPILPLSAPSQRTTTRIGISSLTRALSKPTMSIYNQFNLTNGQIISSEPNLYINSKIWSKTPHNNLQDANFFSLPLNGNSNFNGVWDPPNYTRSIEDINKTKLRNKSELIFDLNKKSSRTHSDPQSHYQVCHFTKPSSSSSPSPSAFVKMSSSQQAVECTPQSFHQSLNDIAITSIHPIRQVGSEINVNNINNQPIFLPPPPDYANSLSQINIPSVSPSFKNKQNGFMNNQISGQLNDHNDGSISDLNQLRQNKDLKLPLITALLNDRSLMMLPKTVPTCSRQRHIGTPRDTRRFSCSYEDDKNAIINNNNNNNQLENDVPFSMISSSSRPMSWHLDLPNNFWENYKQQKQQTFSTSDFIERIWAEHQLTT